MIKSALLLAFFFFSLFSFAQFGPGKDIAYGQSFFIKSVDAGDLDGDGDNDILEVSRGSYWNEGRLVWYENLGNETYSNQKIIYDTNPRVYCSEIVDLDGDGDLDVATGTGLEISWFENDGSGIFSAKQVLVADFQPDFLQSFDADMDGDNDILSVSDYSGKVSWFENTGTGVFGSEQNLFTYSWNSSKNHALAADIDNDGYEDILITSEQRHLSGWMKNLGNGQFATLDTISDELMISFPSAIACADFDQDSDLDVVVVRETELFLFEFDGSDFIPRDTIALSSGILEHLQTTDMDQDGDNDILVALNGSWEGNKLIWIENPGNVAFGPIHISAEVAYTNALATAHLDSDGFPDFIHAVGEQMIVRKNENGTAGPMEVINTVISQPNNLVSADLDNDGDQDVVVSGGNFSWFENLGNAVFSSQHLLSDESEYTRSVVVEDFDGDGDLDVAGTVWANNQVKWFPNEGQGNFGSPILISGDVLFPDNIMASDFDHNGFPDLVCKAFARDSIVVFRNFAGNFTAPTYLTKGASLYDIHFSDLNNDGNTDIVASYADSTINWFPNAGNGTFSAPELIAQPNGIVNAFTCKDFDGDGDQDIVSGILFGKLIWLVNNGNGVFGEPQQIADIEVSDFMRSEDMDGDNDQDILIGAVVSGDLLYLENLSDGHFGDPIAVNDSLEQFSVQSLAIGDLNGDGRPDVISGAYKGEVYWFENLVAQKTPVNGIFVYPNPFTSELSLIFEEYQHGQTDLEIVNLSGGIVYSRKAVDGKTEEFDLSSIAAGVYVVRTINRATGKRFSRRLVKM